MADTPRSKSDFLNDSTGLFKNNQAGEIGAGDLRDFVESSYQPQGLFTFRIGLEQDVEASTTDQANKGTVYVNTCGANKVALYDNTSWALYTPQAFALGGLAGLASGSLYDVFAAKSVPTHSGTSAATDVVTWAANPGWTTGTYVFVVETSGGLTAGVDYWYNRAGANSGSFHSTLANAVAGTSKVDLTGDVSQTLIGIYCDLGPAWTSSSARGTGAGTTELTLVDGVLVNAVAMTGVVGGGDVGIKSGLYVGTIRANSSTTTTDTDLHHYIWNNYNKRSRRMVVYNASTHSYTGTWRYWNNDVEATKLDFVIGVAEPANVKSIFTIWNDSPSAESLCHSDADYGHPAVTVIGGISTSLRLYGESDMNCPIGYHYTYLNEYGNGTFNSCQNMNTVMS